LIKNALTDVIIMQTRLNEREKILLELLKQSAEQQAIDGIPVEPQVEPRPPSPFSLAHGSWTPVISPHPF
jgi:hypothetical protein